MWSRRWVAATLLGIGLSFGVAADARADDGPVQVIPAPTVNDSEFGRIMDVEGGLLVVLGGDGFVSTYELASGVWSLVDRFDADVFGMSVYEAVAVEGEWLVVSHATAVDVYARSGDGWAFETSLSYPEGLQCAAGTVVELEGAVLVAGHRGCPDGGQWEQGVVMVHELVSGVWGPVTELVDPVTTYGSRFAEDVMAFDGTTLVVVGENTAYVYDATAAWAQVDSFAFGANDTGLAVAGDFIAQTVRYASPLVFDPNRHVLVRVRSGSDWVESVSLPWGDAPRLAGDWLSVGETIYHLESGVWQPYSAHASNDLLWNGQASLGSYALAPPFLLAGYPGGDIEVYDFTAQCEGVPATILGTTGDDEIIGTDGDDVIFASGGDDHITGGLGVDIVCAGPGDDTLVDTAGEDHYYGALGFDTVDYFLRSSGAVVDLGAGSGPDGDELRAVEGVVGSEFPDVLIGSLHSNRLEGGRGNDRLDGAVDAMTSTGVDELDGGPGKDTVIYENETVSLRIDLGTGETRRGSSENLAWTGGQLLDLLTRIEHVYGTPFGDVIVGNANNNRIRARQGQDIVLPGGGDDIVWGGDNRDTISYVGYPGPVLIDVLAPYVLGAGVDLWDSVETFEGSDGDDTIFGSDDRDRLFGGPGHDALFGFAGRDHLEGGPGHDLIVAGDGVDTIFGDFCLLCDANYLTGPGDDYLIPGRGDDQVDGGQGSDIVSFEYATAPITLDLDDYTSTATGDGTDTLQDVDSIVGSEFGDTFTVSRETSSGGPGLVLGLAGDDSITIATGRWTYVVPGLGDDAVEASDPKYLFLEYSDATADLVITLVAPGLYGSVTGWGTDSLLNVINVVGGWGDDVITGWAPAAWPYSVTLAGLEGNDTIHGNASASDDIFGGAGNDTLYAYDGNDYVDGGAGDDLLYGHGGDDLLFGDVGDDTGYASTGDDICVAVEHRNSCETQVAGDGPSLLADTVATGWGGEVRAEVIRSLFLAQWAWSLE